MIEHTMQDVQDFLALNRIAVVGLSRDSGHFSRILFREFLHRGYDPVPVNPAADQIEALPCFPSVHSIAPPVAGALILTRPPRTAEVVKQCYEAGIHFIWLYRGAGPGSVSPEAVGFARSHAMRIVAGECPFMFWQNAGWFHTLHRTIRRVTGGLPAA